MTKKINQRNSQQTLLTATVASNLKYALVLVLLGNLSMGALVFLKVYRMKNTLIHLHVVETTRMHTEVMITYHRLK